MRNAVRPWAWRQLAELSRRSIQAP